MAHASACKLGEECSSKHCRKMKDMLLHIHYCKIQATNGCPTCKRMKNLIPLHARNCSDAQCMVPGCVVKEHPRYGRDGAIVGAAGVAPVAIFAEEIEEFLDDISVITGK